MMRVLRSLPLLVLTLALLLPATALAGRPTGVTIRVDDDGAVGANGCHGQIPASDTIQEAVDSVGPESTILVCAGKYTGNVQIEGSQHDGLTLLGVVDWKSVIVPIDDFEGKLLTIEEADRGDHPAPQVPHPRVDVALLAARQRHHIDESRAVRILANMITAVGENTLGCGYSVGIKTDFPREGNVSSVTIAWNTITNFAVNGIEVCGRNRPTLIHQNSLRFLHEGVDPITRASAIFAYCSIHTGPTTITSNVIRTLPTAGVSTPALFRGIDIGCCVDLVRGNRISGARIGIDIDAQVVPTLIRRNTLAGGPDPSESVGTEISSNGGIPVRLRGNDISGYRLGVDVLNWSGHLIADNDLRGNTIACQEVADDGGTPNTWSGNLGCPSPTP